MLKGPLQRVLAQTPAHTQHILSKQGSCMLVQHYEVSAAGCSMFPSLRHMEMFQFLRFLTPASIEEEKLKA